MEMAMSCQWNQYGVTDDNYNEMKIQKISTLYEPLCWLLETMALINCIFPY